MCLTVDLGSDLGSIFGQNFSGGFRGGFPVDFRWISCGFCVFFVGQMEIDSVDVFDGGFGVGFGIDFLAEFQWWISMWISGGLPVVFTCFFCLRFLSM